MAADTFVIRASTHSPDLKRGAEPKVVGDEYRCGKCGRPLQRWVTFHPLEAMCSGGAAHCATGYWFTARTRTAA